jgi:membrane protein DedA with SNARE-associated domain
MAQFVAIYGIWLVSVFIALESVGVPVPAEASLMAAGFFAARNKDVDISILIGSGVLAAIVGETTGFWIGRRYGSQILHRYGPRVGLTAGRIRIGQWLFGRYGGRFVFVARFLPILRNMAAVLAGTSKMTQPNFYFASCTAAVVWIMCYGLGSYLFGKAFTSMASPAAVVLGIASLSVIFLVPTLIVRYEVVLLKATEPAPTPCQEA